MLGGLVLTCVKMFIYMAILIACLVLSPGV